MREAKWQVLTGLGGLVELLICPILFKWLSKHSNPQKNCFRRLHRYGLRSAPSGNLHLLQRALFGIERVKSLLPAKLWDDVPVFLEIVAVERAYGAPGYDSVVCPDCSKKRFHARVCARAALHVDQSAIFECDAD